jgi:hypothetical protein
MTRNLIIVIFFIALSCSPLKKYQNTDEVKAWEPAIQNFEQIDKKVSYPNNAIIFAGSSSILLWSTLEKDMAPYPVIHRGYGGAKLSDFAVYAERIFDPHPCSAIVIFIANDITGNKNDKSVHEVGALMKNVLKSIRRTHRETPVFWIAITPTVSRWNAWPEIRKANNMIKSICESHSNTYFIKTDSAFLDEKGKPQVDLFRSDNLHLSDKGYIVWTGIIKKELARVLEK